MGIIEQELADFELSDGAEYRIEFNRNGIIHLHVDGVRIEMTPDEFEQFAAVVSDVKSDLIDVKGLDR